MTLANSQILAATDSGRGEVVVLLHGWAMSRRVFDDYIEHLAVHRRVIALDLRGHGDSPAPADGYSLEDLAGDVLATLHSMGIQRFALLGWSVGAAVACLVAARHPDAVTRLILVSTAAPVFVQRADFLHALPKSVAAGIGEGELSDREAFRRYVISSLTAAPLPAAIGEALYSESLKARSGPVLALLDSLVQSDLRQQLASIQCPILLVHGEFDQFSPLSKAQWIVEHQPRARLISLADCGHAPFLEHPQAFNTQVLDFLLGDGGRSA